MMAINLTIDAHQSRATVAPTGRKKPLATEGDESHHFPTAQSSACISVLVFLKE
jgi:hypothetical protein